MLYSGVYRRANRRDAIDQTSLVYSIEVQRMPIKVQGVLT
jgi:hypothetical protein